MNLSRRGGIFFLSLRGKEHHLPDYFSIFESPMVYFERKFTDGKKKKREKKWKTSRLYQPFFLFLFICNIRLKLLRPFENLSIFIPLVVCVGFFSYWYAGDRVHLSFGHTTWNGINKGKGIKMSGKEIFFLRFSLSDKWYWEIVM